MFQHKCKICRSSKADDIEFCRFYLQWKYTTLVDVFSDDIDNLNCYNLSNHLNNHADSENRRFWQNLRDSIGIYDLSAEESKTLFEKMKIGLGSSD